MKAYTIEEMMTKLMKNGGFGEVIFPVEPVSGGFMHRMYKVRTETGIYAVKHLNPEIMARDGVLDNYARAEKLERLLEEAEIPIVPAVTVHGKKMQTTEGNYFYIFHWQEGHITDWDTISTEECRMAGTILGKIHAINPQNVAHKEPEQSNINWYGYLQKAETEKNETASVLAENIQLLIHAEKELNAARSSLPDILCISNEDMDPKNVMWENGKPLVIDLECLDYGNPVSHALQLALQWAGTITYNIDVEKITAFFEGYLAVYDNGFRAYSSVFGLAYTWVEWLEYNIQRALGACVDEAERTLGISEVNNTINRINYIRSMEKEIKEALDSRLPQSKAAYS
ncbi:MAG: aminoglycoside phosphotransferase family protein [Lachnospiraceae bacterium]|nr:aminoglycoside phosphotransferase family protein [Lachnospiraceae bacterium]